jgi:hypothetical protein
MQTLKIFIENIKCNLDAGPGPKTVEPDGLCQTGLNLSGPLTYTGLKIMVFAYGKQVRSR